MTTRFYPIHPWVQLNICTILRYHKMITVFCVFPVQDPRVMRAPCLSSCCPRTCGCCLCRTWWCSGWRRPAPTGASCSSSRTRASLHSWVWQRDRADASSSLVRSSSLFPVNHCVVLHRKLIHECPGSRRSVRKSRRRLLLWQGCGQSEFEHLDDFLTYY